MRLASINDLRSNKPVMVNLGKRSIIHYDDDQSDAFMYNKKNIVNDSKGSYIF